MQGCQDKGRGQVEKELLLDRVRQASKTACFGDKMVVVLDTLLDTPVFGVGAGEELPLSAFH